MIKIINSINRTVKSSKLSNGKNINFKGEANIKNDSVELSPLGRKISELYKNYETATIEIEGKRYTKFIASKVGSNPANWIKDNETGELFYMKVSLNPFKAKHFKEEAAASKLYKLAGIDAPEMKVCTFGNGMTGLMSKFEPNLDYMPDMDILREGFAADCWLANWDSMNGNTLTKDGKMFKLDNGGALRYRAQGMPKYNFNETVDEIITLVDGRNPATYAAYSSLDYDTLVKSFKRVINISDEDIKNTVEDNELAEILIKRKKYMEDFYEVIEKTPYNGNNLCEYLTDIKHKVEEK